MSGVEMWFLIGFAVAANGGGGWFSADHTERASHMTLGTEPFYATEAECREAAKAGKMDRLSDKVTKFVTICVPGYVVDRP